MAKCLTTKLDESSMIDVQQDISISWLNQNRTTQIVEKSFTYMPDPVIKSIQPNETIMRFVNVVEL